MPTDLDAAGCWIDPGFLPPPDCLRLLARIDAECRRAPPPEIRQSAGDRPLHYRVLDGHRIAAHLPELLALRDRVATRVVQLCGRPLVPLADARVACNVNITPPGGSYRWHYDRNAVTAIVYLNAVHGGATECYPGHRLLMPRVAGGRYGRLQRAADALYALPPVRRLSGRRRLVEPAPGTLLVMRGDRCLHSVRPVAGDTDRVNLVMSFDAPGARYEVAGQLDAYLYGDGAPDGGDPNYRRAGREPQARRGPRTGPGAGAAVSHQHRRDAGQ